MSKMGCIDFEIILFLVTATILGLGSLALILDFIFGSTILATILLISCSKTFKFCVYHRVIIVCNVFIQLMYEINEITEIILLIFQFITYNVLLIYYIKHKAKL